MNAPSPARFPWIGLVTSALLTFVLGYTVVAGAVSANWRVGAELRDLMQREMRIAEAAGLDLAALRRGKEEYLTTCTACHGPLGEAKPNLGKDLGHSAFIASKSDTEMLMFLKLGRNTWEPENTTGVAMPPKGGNPMLNDDDLRDITEYLRYLQAFYKTQ
ncbi:MAG: c-type cytochrome [Phycisphaerales bacterium JB039]